MKTVGLGAVRVEAGEAQAERRARRKVEEGRRKWKVESGRLGGVEGGGWRVKRDA
jgi:hypothetical protein